MSQPNNPIRPSKSMDVYTVMLMASFVALLIGFICMSIEWSRYNAWLSWKTDSAKVRTSYHVSAPVVPTQNHLA